MPKRVVLRLGKRRTSWEKSDPREIAALEFSSREGGLDHRPSVYVLQPSLDSEVRPLATRVRAEHQVSFMSPPDPSGTAEHDLEGLPGALPVSCPGKTKFSFANTVHAELHLQDDEAVFHLVEQLLAQRTARVVALSQSDTMSYVRSRLAADDPEWVAAINGLPRDKAPRWRKLVDPSK